MIYQVDAVTDPRRNRKILERWPDAMEGPPDTWWVLLKYQGDLIAFAEVKRHDEVTFYDLTYPVDRVIVQGRFGNVGDMPTNAKPGMRLTVDTAACYLTAVLPSGERVRLE